MKKNNDMYLVYVKYFATNPDGKYVYELYYSEVPDVVWGLDWECMNPAICEDLTPDKSGIAKTEKIISRYKLKTIQETSCLSMEYAINGIIALSWIDIELLEEYPDEGRAVLKFGMNEEEVKNIAQKIA